LLRGRVHGEGFTRDRWNAQSVFYGREFFPIVRSKKRRWANAGR
jgi:hypothetical protein